MQTLYDFTVKNEITCSKVPRGSKVDSVYHRRDRLQCRGPNGVGQVDKTALKDSASSRPSRRQEVLPGRESADGEPRAVNGQESGKSAASNSRKASTDGQLLARYRFLPQSKRRLEPLTVGQDQVQRPQMAACIMTTLLLSSSCTNRALSRTSPVTSESRISLHQSCQSDSSQPEFPSQQVPRRKPPEAPGRTFLAEREQCEQRPLFISFSTFCFSWSRIG